MANDEIKKLLPNFENGVYYGQYTNVKFDTAYQTSKLRENLINWYPFEEYSTVLFISSGAGALIPYLCQNTGYVTVIEESKDNCHIIEKRCAEFNNLKIIQKDFMTYNSSEKFDYILIDDYLTQHLNCEIEKNFFQDFITKVSTNLLRNGKLLLAINNSFGLRYLNGGFCHSKDMNLFDNLIQPDLFTKAELETIFIEAGMKYYKFYYPFPDFAFPRSIYTDESLKNMRYGHHYNDYGYDRYQLFDEFVMYHKLQINGVVDKFVNSFFIEVCRYPFQDNNIIYAKNQYFIDKKVKFVTIIYTGKSKKVEKKALTPEAKEYLFKNYNDSLKLNSAKHCFGYVTYLFDRKRGVLQMPFVNGISVSDQLEYILQEILKSNNYNELYDEIINILSEIYSTMKMEAVLRKPEEIFNKWFQDNFGDTTIDESLYCLNPVTLDLHLDHIFPGTDGYEVIDLDPIVFFDVPIDYLMWCMIDSWHYTYIFKNKKLEKLFSVRRVCTDLGIKIQNIEIFRKWRQKVYDNQSAVSQIQPFYSRIFSPNFLSYNKIQEYGVLRNSDSRVMNAMKNKVKAETFRITHSTPIILYGAAAIGKLFYRILSERGYQVKVFMDKRFDEISNIEGLPVISIDADIDKKDYVIIIAIKNVFEQEQIAKELFRRGYEKIIYRPKKIVDGESDEQLQILSDVYDEIERFKWITDIAVPLNLRIDIPKTRNLPKIVLEDRAIKLRKNDNVITNIPLVHIYTAQQQLMPDYPWAEKNIISLVPHTALYKYLWNGGEDKTDWYIDFCSYGARNNSIEITQRWKQNLINNRLIVLQAMEKSLEQDFDFFYRNPPAGLWNEEQNYFNLNGGRHRAALFVYKNFYTMPLEISKIEYDKYLNLSMVTKIENYMNENDIDSLEVPISHPCFYNIPSRRPQYYQCVIRPIFEYVSEYELNTHGIIRFQEYNFLICAEDLGELRRCLTKSGFYTQNLSELSVFENLLDRLFYIKKHRELINSDSFLFFDCSTKGTNILSKINLYRNYNIITIFILVDFKSLESVKDILNYMGFSRMTVIKKCYWKSQEVYLLAFSQEG